MSDIITSEHKTAAGELKRALAIYRDSEDLINIGAYVKGSNEKIDYAIKLIDGILNFVQQSTEERFTYDEVLELLNNVVKL